MERTRTLDRLKQFDEKSRQFRLIGAVDTELAFRSYTWPCRTWNDQGSEGACVGFAISHELAAVPVKIPTDNTLARNIYHRARFLDPWPGENYEGTSVLAGMKAMIEMYPGFEYRWAFGLEDLIRALGRKGPAVLGVDWWTGMFNTDAKGFLHVSGSIAGGHAIMARGVTIRYRKDVPLIPNRMDSLDLDASYITLHNSWGKDWGVNGTARITLRDMDILLKAQGEAVIPVKRAA